MTGHWTIVLLYAFFHMALVLMGGWTVGHGCPKPSVSKFWFSWMAGHWVTICSMLSLSRFWRCGIAEDWFKNLLEALLLKVLVWYHWADGGWGEGFAWSFLSQDSGITEWLDTGPWFA